MLAVALHLRGQELSLRDIAARLVIATGKKKGQHPSPATVMRMLREHDEKIAEVGAAGCRPQAPQGAGSRLARSVPAAHVRPPVGGRLHQLVFDGTDHSQRPAFELVDVDEAEGQAVPGLDREPAVRQCLRDRLLPPGTA
jgi:hypothetical protein